MYVDSASITHSIFSPFGCIITTELMPPKLAIKLVNPPNPPNGGTFEFDVTHVTFNSTTTTYPIIPANNTGITSITDLIPNQTYSITEKTLPTGFTID